MRGKTEIHHLALEELCLQGSQLNSCVYNRTDKQDGQTDSHTEVILLHALLTTCGLYHVHVCFGKIEFNHLVLEELCLQGFQTNCHLEDK